MQEANHEEIAPHATLPLIHRLVCSLVGQVQTIRFRRGSLAHRTYGGEETVEQFRCNFGLNPAYRERILSGPLHCTGTDQEGEARVIELTTHRFFVATLFLPQLSSSPNRPHPLIMAYLQAAVAFYNSRKGNTHQRKVAT